LVLSRIEVCRRGNESGGDLEQGGGKRDLTIKITPNYPPIPTVGDDYRLWLR